MKKNKFLWFIIVCFLFANLSIAGTVRKTFRKTIHFTQNGMIYIENSNGNIEIESWDKDDVEIFAEIKVKASSRRGAEDLIDRVEIITNRRGNNLDIYSDYPRRGGGFLSALFSNINVSISYRIKLPKYSDLDIHTTNGKIIVYELNGNVYTKTTNGSIYVERINGSVNAITTNGSIKAEILQAKSKNNMNFKSTNGSIKLYLPRNISADIYANTTNGRVYCDFLIDTRDRRRYYNDNYRRKRTLRGRINGGGVDIEVKTTNGSISILEY